MSALPIQPDPALTEAIAQVSAMRRDFAELEGQLSAAEVQFAAEANARPWRPKGLPVTEIDATLTIPGQKPVELTLAVWGKFHKAHKGYAPKGERQIEPDEPACFEVDAVMIGDTDVTAEIGQAGEDAVAFYVMENCK